jgi:hypothetical protein
MSCDSKKPFVCNCDTSFLSYNDSLFGDFRFYSTYDSICKNDYGLEWLSNYENESYRLSMRHSFSRYFQIYTLSKTSSGGLLEVKQFYNKKDFGDILDLKYEVNLTKTQWEKFKKEIDSSCYWSNQIGKDKCQDCLDGGTWLLQGYDPEKRNCANRTLNIDGCDYGSKHELGNLCRTIRKYAKEEKIETYHDL